MSDLHELCYFKSRPITRESYVVPLKEYLSLGIPATYTLEEAYNYENNIEEDPKSTTTPLHLICENIPEDYDNEEEAVILSMIEELFLNGAGWSLLNDRGETPGCVLQRRSLVATPFWNSIVDAGVRAEMLLRKIDDVVEFLSDDEIPHQEEEIPELVESESELKNEPKEETKEETKEEPKEDIALEETGNPQDASNNQDIYLKSKLEYKDGALVTDEKDGVMMQWEENLMNAGCVSLFKNTSQNAEEDINILNIGFGMGIIDTMIQERKPSNHYICEAHPDVLAKLKSDGWYEKPGVHILEGRWQDTLPELLSKGVFFDGIYYDTFSEHYEDMLELFDFIVGLLKPEGVFSFFNGLGADRYVVYEVYKRLVELDLNNYGLKVSFKELKPDSNTLLTKEESVWKDIKRSYWNCPVYYHPEAEFM